MTPAQKGLIEKLDGIIEALANVTTLLEASFDTHPELPLGMETAKPEDPTRRVLPWGDLPAPPPAPAGKVWVNRGTFENECIYAEGREVRYLGSLAWVRTRIFSTNHHHIELIDANP